MKLAQGEYIEFTGEFVADKVPQSRASLATSSDAEAEVTSNWTGAGIAQGIRVTADVIQTCVYHPVTVTCVIYNTGSSDLFIDSLVLQPLDQASQGKFEFVTPSDAAGGYQISAGAFRQVEIRYLAVPNTPVTNLQTHQANLVAYNTSLFTPIAVSETPVVGSCEHHDLSTSLILSKSKTTIGDVVDGRIMLAQGDDVSMATVTELDITIQYKGDFLRVEEKDVKIEGVMKNQFSVSNLNINDIAGTVTMTLTGGPFNYPAGGELVSFRIATYLPKDTGSISDITHTVTTNDRCVDIATVNTSLEIEPTCVYDLRKVVLTQTSYGMKAINPNPVTNGNAEIEFSVGLKGYTEIKIFNANSEVVAIPVKEELQPGIYSINLNVNNMPNGAYWYEMSSGPFHSTEKMIIAK
jgi:hypothetical protein